MSDIPHDDEISEFEQAAWDAWAEEEARIDRINRWKAAWMLLTTTQEDLACVGFFQRTWLRILCLICLAMWWRWTIEEDVWNTLTLGAWDHQDDGYFWNEYVLHFNPKQFRVEIIRDGDGESPY